MTGKRNRFLTDSFHQTAITCHDIGEVINKAVIKPGGQVTFCHSHTDSIGNALSKRPCCGLNTGGMASFGMACGQRAKLAEIPQLLNAHLWIAG